VPPFDKARTESPELTSGHRAPTLHRRANVRAQAVSRANLSVPVVVVKFAPDNEIRHRQTAGPSILATIPTRCRRGFGQRLFVQGLTMGWVA
jgi:hypothetical protein